MKVDIETISDIQKKISIQVPTQTVQTRFASAHHLTKKTAQVPGFRQGKVPDALIEKRFGPALRAQALQELVQESLEQAIKENELNAITIENISKPELKEDGLIFDATLEVKPQLSVKNYTDVKIKDPSIKVTDKEIEATLKRLQESQSVLKPKENAIVAHQGDFVSLEIEDLIVLDPNKKTQPQLQMYEVGSGQKNLDEALIKMNVGQSETVTLTGFKDGQDLKVRVTLKDIKEKILPKLDDEFAKSVGPFENLDALKKRILEDLNEEASAKTREDKIKAIMDIILEANPISLPNAMVNHEKNYLNEQFLQRMRWSGVNNALEQYPKDKLEQDLLIAAKRNVHEQLLIESIAKQEKIEVSENEINEEISKIAKANRSSAQELKKQYQQSGRIHDVVFHLLSQKTLDFVLSKATIQ